VRAQYLIPGILSKHVIESKPVDGWCGTTTLLSLQGVLVQLTMVSSQLTERIFVSNTYQISPTRHSQSRSTNLLYTILKH
jgi:hypothetical protein